MSDAFAIKPHSQLWYTTTTKKNLTTTAGDDIIEKLLAL